MRQATIEVSRTGLRLIASDVINQARLRATVDDAIRVVSAIPGGVTTSVPELLRFRKLTRRPVYVTVYRVTVHQPEIAGPLSRELQSRGFAVRMVEARRWKPKIVGLVLAIISTLIAS